jgi:hypothetical protein
MSNPQQQADDLLQPILDLATGADGGAAFTRLRFGFLPEIIARHEAGDKLATELVLHVSSFSRLCSILLKKDAKPPERSGI